MTGARHSPAGRHFPAPGGPIHLSLAGTVLPRAGAARGGVPPRAGAGGGTGAGPGQRSLSRPLIHCSVAGISRRQVLKLWPPLSRMIDEIRVSPLDFTRSMKSSVAR